MVCPHNVCVGSQLNIFSSWNENAMASGRISRQICFQKGETRDHSWRLAQIYFQQCYWKNSSYWHTRWSIRSWKRIADPMEVAYGSGSVFFVFYLACFLLVMHVKYSKVGFWFVGRFWYWFAGLQINKGKLYC